MRRTRYEVRGSALATTCGNYKLLTPWIDLLSKSLHLQCELLEFYASGEGLTENPLASFIRPDKRWIELNQHSDFNSSTHEITSGAAIFSLYNDDLFGKDSDAILLSHGFHDWHCHSLLIYCGEPQTLEDKYETNTLPLEADSFLRISGDGWIENKSDFIKFLIKRSILANDIISIAKITFNRDWKWNRIIQL